MEHGMKVTSQHRGKVLARRISHATLVATIVTIVIFADCLSFVPWDTRITYQRLSNDWSLPVGVLVVPCILLCVIWWKGRSDQKEGVRPSERVAAVLVVGLFLSIVVGIQSYLAYEFAQTAGLWK